MNENSNSRRDFIRRASGFLMAGAMLSAPVFGQNRFQNKNLQVWSCGGLAEAFIPANKEYENLTGCKISYTGAFAAALGKSLLGGATTEVFAPRVLELARKLREKGKMLYFKPLCFTKYVLVTPVGNPAGIKAIEDLGRDGVKVVLSPNASPPGGEASMKILEKAGILDKAKKNAIVMGDCVQTIMPYISEGKGDVAIVELRLSRLPLFSGKVDVIDLPLEAMPPKPLPFTIGVMSAAKEREFADDYVNFILSDKGRSYFESAGFIHAGTAEGQKLIEKLGVKDA